jgi:hypothetical protein
MAQRGEVDRGLIGQTISASRQICLSIPPSRVCEGKTFRQSLSLLEGKVCQNGSSPGAPADSYQKRSTDPADTRGWLCVAEPKRVIRSSWMARNDTKCVTLISMPAPAAAAKALAEAELILSSTSVLPPRVSCAPPINTWANGETGPGRRICAPNR